MTYSISANDPYERKRIQVLDTEMAYIDEGEGDPVVFLHGNPTSSYLWRNVIPEVAGEGRRVLAPDLVGMGESGKAPDGSYRFFDHARYLDAWFDALALDNVVLVIHDWGSGLGFHWANRHRERVRGICYMEAFVRPVSWEEWPDSATKIFKLMRSQAGEKFVLEKNGFVEKILPSSVIREMTEEEMNVYRKPFPTPEDRQPTLTWPREIPFDGEPADMQQAAQAYAEWLAVSDVPKLFIDAEPGTILTGGPREFCRQWPNQTEVKVKGLHFIQEDSPAEIGQAVDQFISALK
ncbi:haloalkane dehalogenase [Planococcus lenghuensis]|uniref:Haloalkane dehalogenase n=1 Tax=Planococcus lenghuensis TaxID=2213202 RepID=A0A1Q2KZ83_9BACL|nr:haloalkane dehalogenase [Planococcus lenghuensis]AQQ53434.1 haloalkane dehalogenase [Planococcus lenghuensis]